jgi:hypothetical protein
MRQILLYVTLTHVLVVVAAHVQHKGGCLSQFKAGRNILPAGPTYSCSVSNSVSRPHDTEKSSDRQIDRVLALSHTQTDTDKDLVTLQSLCWRQTSSLADLAASSGACIVQVPGVGHVLHGVTPTLHRRGGVERTSSNEAAKRKMYVFISLSMSNVIEKLLSKAEAGFLVRVHPEPCLILSRARIRALLCS